MNQASRILRNIAAGLLLLIGVALLLGWWGVRRSLPTLDGSVVVRGLKDGVIVDRDQWGRPWIRAKSLDDLVLAQGYVMAQDRLWQMDLLRRAAAGELAEIFGQAALEIDTQNRVLGMRQAAERAASDSNPQIRSLLEAYSAGVNRYIEERRNRLPIEFTLLRYEPRNWEPADSYLVSLYMWKTLTSTWKSKLNRQWVSERVGPERARSLFATDSALDHFIVGGYPPTHSGPGTENSASRPEGEAESASLTIRPSAEPIWEKASDYLEQFGEDASEGIGSNSFVVNWAYSASRKPLLANDTHLGLGVPSLWYLVHLTAPGWNVEGFALPGAPLVIIGHNDQIAWGFTNSNIDVQDVYAETFEREGSLNYRLNGQWIPAEVRKEIIHVRGKPDVELGVVVTRHGPIVHRDPADQGGRAYALRWTALEPGGLEFGFPMLGGAKNWNEFVGVTRHITGPGQNTIYADVEGNIGFTIPARIPIRANGNGALPVAGDTDEFEWKGYVPFEELPRVLNPPEGILATANARNVGPGYKYFLSDRWAGPYRTERIYQMLAGRTDLRVADMNAIQNDILSLPDKYLADQLVKATRARPANDPRTADLVKRLAGWDARTGADSELTSFVEYTRHAVFHNLLSPFLDDSTSKYELWEPESLYEEIWWRDKVFLQNVLEGRPAVWLPKGFTSYDDLLIASADQAAAQLDKETGGHDSKEWLWGRLRPLEMLHPLGRSGLLHGLLSVGPYEQSGTIDTVKAMGVGHGPGARVGHGPAMRFVADLANWDQSMMEISTGESGQYGSAYYRDQFPEWFGGRGIPAPFSEAAEEGARKHRLLLLPARAKASDVN